MRDDLARHACPGGQRSMDCPGVTVGIGRLAREEEGSLYWLTQAAGGLKPTGADEAICTTGKGASSPVVQVPRLQLCLEQPPGYAQHARQPFYRLLYDDRLRLTCQPSGPRPANPAYEKRRRQRI